MNLTIAVAVSNGITVTASLVCCVACLYKRCWQHMKPRPLVASTLIITLTMLMFGLQVTFPEVLQALRRDIGSLRSGEWWRIITPLFVQPQGTLQLLFNMMFLVVFLPMCERIYGTRLWLLFFIPGVVGQLVNYAWSPSGGGSSPAAFGVMGSILIYVLLNSRSAPRQYSVFAILGICGAVTMCFTRDGHGPSLLTGAVIAALICWLSPPSQPKNMLSGTG